MSTLPAESNNEEIVEIRLSFTNFSISFLFTFVPINLDFKSDLI